MPKTKGQLTQNKTEQKQILSTTEAQEHVQRTQLLDSLNADQQNTTQRSSAYSDFFRHMTSLDTSIPVADGQAGQEEHVGYKERKRRRKELERQREEYEQLNQKLSKSPRLLSEDEMRTLPIFKSPEATKKWADEKLSHSTLTREETMRQVGDGDFSNFENLDHVLRNVLAGNAFRRFMEDYEVSEQSNPEELCRRIKESGEGVSALLDPTLRLGLSLAQRSDRFSPELKDVLLRLDEAMSTAVMTETLTHVASLDKVKQHFRKKGSSNPDADANRAITENKAQQIQIAKRLLLMQLSEFREISKGDNGSTRVTKWQRSMAVALSHCSRVSLTLPPQGGIEDIENNAAAQQEMWRAILTIGGENPAQDNGRASSTHSIKRRKVGGKDGEILEKKLPFNLIGQRGMNCAIGGLGNAGVSGRMLCNDGSCGHFYSMYKTADAKHCGAMLMGLESDAAGVTNQMGHTHDIHATAEKASSLGGQRIDEVGVKYGGRQCDLNGMSASHITEWMLALEKTMQRWQAEPSGMSSGEAAETMAMLTGRKLERTEWNKLRHRLGVSDRVPDGDHR